MFSGVALLIVSYLIDGCSTYNIVGRNPAETGLPGVMHTDAECDDCIILISECRRQ